MTQESLTDNVVWCAVNGSKTKHSVTQYNIRDAIMKRWDGAGMQQWLDRQINIEIDLPNVNERESIGKRRG